MDSVHQDDLAFPNVPGLLVDAPVAFAVAVDVVDDSHAVHAGVDRMNIVQHSRFPQTIGDFRGRYPIPFQKV